MAKPLRRLTEKTVKYECTSKCQAAFKKLHQRLVSAPVLAFPDYSKHFVLYTDASDKGIGAELSQTDDDGLERVITYASNTLSKAERK